MFVKTSAPLKEFNVRILKGIILPKALNYISLLNMTVQSHKF